MNARHFRLENLLATLLKYGTWAASFVTGLGIILALIDSPKSPNAVGTHVMSWGIAFFILMPVLRVVLMLAVYFRERDYRLAAAAAVVLLNILCGIVLGLYLAASAS